MDNDELAALMLLLRAQFGSGVELVNYQIGNRQTDYLVLLLQLARPSLDVVVKLAGPKAVYACRFDRTAAIQQWVAANTTIPMPEIIAVDVSCDTSPWRYLIMTHVSGQEWAYARPQMNGVQLREAYRQLGDAVGQLHRGQLPAFGDFDPPGAKQNGTPYVEVLAKHASAIIENERLRDYFQAALARDAHLFAEVTTPNLCHEDLHGYNILFERRDSTWRLATILDFDKAWAGHHESDLARMELWTGMTSLDFWQAYEVVHRIDPGYKQRRPLYQLLWCLEYAQPTAKHLADTQQVCRELGMPLIRAFTE